MSRPAEVGPMAPARELDPAILHKLSDLGRKLDRAYLEALIDLGQVALTNGHRRILTVPNWPVSGSRRYVISQNGFGGKTTIAANTPTLVLPSNPSRLGLTIVNIGTGDLTLYGCTLGEAQGAQLPACPTWPLTPGGGSWDGRLGRINWCGDVIAISVAGTTYTLAAG